MSNDLLTLYILKSDVTVHFQKHLDVLYNLAFRHGGEPHRIHVFNITHVGNELLEVDRHVAEVDWLLVRVDILLKVRVCGGRSHFHAQLRLDDQTFV